MAAKRILVAALGLGVAGATAALVLQSSPEPISTTPPGPVPATARYLSPDGSDSDPGTAERPWRSLSKAVESVRPGATVVLRPGTYGAPGETHLMNRGGTEDAPIIWRGDPGQTMPRIVGHVRILAGDQRFAGILFDGPTGPVQAATADNPDGEQVQVAVGGEDQPVARVEISGCEIRESGWHAGVYLEEADDVRLVGNHIHDNGDFDDPSQANQSHGVYWQSGSGLIANNLIEHNVARGVQLYEEPHDVLVAHNTIVRNGRAGIQVGEDASGTLVVNNVVAFNGDVGIRADSLSGGGNRVERNLVWNPAGPQLGVHADGLELDDNLIADPRFEGEGRYRLSGASPAVGEALTDPWVSHDRTGAPRPREGADLGAYERP
jgi:pectate disaccharide-lyase